MFHITVLIYSSFRTGKSASIDNGCVIKFVTVNYIARTDQSRNGANICQIT